MFSDHSSLEHNGWTDRLKRVKARHGSTFARREILHVRHHSPFAPRDFGLSLWFQILQPTLEDGFDPHLLTWEDGSAAPGEKERSDEDVEARRDSKPAEEPEAARDRILGE